LARSPPEGRSRKSTTALVLATTLAGQGASVTVLEIDRWWAVRGKPAPINISKVTDPTSSA
jgi:chromosome partitioning protein